MVIDFQQDGKTRLVQPLIDQNIVIGIKVDLVWLLLLFLLFIIIIIFIFIIII